MNDKNKKSPPFLLNANQVAERLGVSTPKAYSIMRRREMPVVVLGRSVRVREIDLEEFLEFILKYFEDRSYEEISDIMRLPKNTVGTYILRAKKLLRKELGEIND